jgi:adenylate kinase family enzyme
MEGAGKSTLAQQLAYLCDPNLTVDNIVFTPKDFMEAVNKAKPYSCIIYDEAYEGTASDNTMGETVRTIKSFLTQIRQKNLFVFILAPSFFIVTKYIAMWRSKLLINVYVGKGYERGFFMGWTYDHKNLLYIRGRKEYDYSQVHADFRGRFTKQYMVDEQAYREKKVKALEYYSKQQDTIPMNTKTRRFQGLLYYIIRYLVKNKVFSPKDIEKMLINCEHSLKYRQINTIVNGGELDFNDSEEVRAEVDD